MKASWILGLGLTAGATWMLLGGDDAKTAPAGGEQKAAAKDGVELKTQGDKVSYALGMGFGKNLKDQGVECEAKFLLKGVEDGLAGTKALLTEKEMAEVMAQFRKDYMAKSGERAKNAGEKNKKDGAAFLADNGKKPGVQTLPSGLQYKVIQAGTGPKPKLTDKVKTHYRGTLIDGQEFDSSYSRGEPATFPVTGVIKGWTEALQLMPVGSKWQLFVPSTLAYGDRGAGGKIGPGATLIFEIELLSIEG